MDSQNNLNNLNNLNNRDGQNNQIYQNPYADPASDRPLAVPPLEENPYYIDPSSVPSAVIVKKSKKKILIPVIIALLTACAAAAVIVFIILKNKPSAKEVVTKAFTNAFTSDSPSLESRYLGLPELKEKTQNSPYQADVTMHIAELSGESIPEQLSMLDGMEFSVSSARDLQAKRCAGTFSLKDSNFPLDILYYFYDDKISVSVPDLVDGYFTASTENFGEDFNNSALSDMIGQKLDPSFSFNIFDMLGDMSKGGQSQSSDRFDALFDALEYSESSKKATINIGGKDQSCKCYKVVLPAQTLQDLFSSYSGLLAAAGSSYVSPDSLQQYIPTDDIFCYVYTTKKGKLARIEFDQSITAGELTLDLKGTIDFTGKNKPSDEVNGSVDVTLKGFPITLRIASSTDEDSTSSKRNTTLTLLVAGIQAGSLTSVSTFDTTTGKKHSELSVNAIDPSSMNMNQSYVSYTADLLYKDVVPGERFTLEIQNVSFDAMGMITAKINGSCSTAPCSEAIAEPSGQKYDLFSMTADDLQKLILNAVLKKLGSWY